MEFMDLSGQYRYLKEDIDARINKVIESGHFILGEEVTEFEEKLAEYIGVKHAIGCGSGTDALQLIFMAYGIGAGDAVFCPDTTFIASIEPALMLGAYPSFCDINLETFNIDVKSLERQINAIIKDGKYKPRAVVAVDLFGNPTDYEALSAICQKYDLILVEDAAQATGAMYKGKKCGSLGDISATSFFPTKPLGCYGDGGAVFTNDDEMNEVLRSLRVHGKGEDKYHNVRVGINSRLDTLQAAIMLPKFKVLEDELIKRQKVAKRYYEALNDRYKIQTIDDKDRSAYAQYTILAEDEAEREECLVHLKEQDIPAMTYYIVPLHRQGAYKEYTMGEERFESAEAYAQRAFSLPFSPYMSEEEQDMVIRALKF